MDAWLRQLERNAHDDSLALTRLIAARLRAREPEPLVEQFVAALTTEGALWVAGDGLGFQGAEALLQHLLDAGLGWGEAHGLAWDGRLERAVVQTCRERARRDWDPLAALPILGTREAVCAALGIDELPQEAEAIERSLLDDWLKALGLRFNARDEADPLRLWRPPPQPPEAMGWEPLLERRFGEDQLWPLRGAW